MSTTLAISPEEILQWRESRFLLWLHMVDSRVSQEKELEAARIGRAVSLATWNPEALERLIKAITEDHEAAAPQKQTDEEYTEEDIKRIIAKADRIRRMKGSGSYISADREH